MTAPPRRDGERGFLTVQYLVATGLSLVVFTLLANLVVFQYGRGVIRASLDEAARAGSRVTTSPAAAVAACDETAAEARAALLGGALGDGLTIRCEVARDRVVATADAELTPWLPAVPSWRFTERASVPRETRPALLPTPAEAGP